MKKFVSLLLAMLMVLSLVACGGDGGQSNTNSGDKVIKIGVFEPLSGDSASGGKKEVLGMHTPTPRPPRSSSTARRTRSSWFYPTTALPPIRRLPPLPTSCPRAFPSSSALTAPAQPWPAAPSSVRPASPPSA